MTTITLTSSHESATRQIAAIVAEILRPGDVLCLHGQLGAGKTRFVQGLAAALGCESDFVNSPTFVLVQEYAGRLPLYHFDAYRLRDADEFAELGGEELLGGNGVCCIEWATKIAEILPRERLEITIEVTAAESRRFLLQAVGWNAERLEMLQALATR
ncbi:MAG: tRNA (adenosine(37)-N6)-threonylcarbamoyltransferase complex ATPase subunit type 1 TsaE [Planctomycetaceae bacterium]